MQSHKKKPLVRTSVQGGSGVGLCHSDLYSSDGEDPEGEDGPSTLVEEILAFPPPIVIVERLSDSRTKKKKSRSGQTVKARGNQRSRAEWRKRLEVVAPGW